MCQNYVAVHLENVDLGTPHTQGRIRTPCAPALDSKKGPLPWGDVRFQNLSEFRPDVRDNILLGFRGLFPKKM